jgi:hypothetical protein
MRKTATSATGANTRATRSVRRRGRSSFAAEKASTIAMMNAGPTFHRKLGPSALSCPNTLPAKDVPNRVASRFR